MSVKALRSISLRLRCSFCSHNGPNNPRFWNRLRTHSVIISLSLLPGSDAEEFLVRVPLKM